MSNVNIKLALLSRLDLFKKGEISIAELQGSWVSHASAIEAAPDTFRSKVDSIEAQLEVIRFTYNEREARQRAVALLPEIRDSLDWIDLTTGCS